MIVPRSRLLELRFLAQCLKIRLCDWKKLKGYFTQSGPWARAQGYSMSPLRGWRIAGQPQFLNGQVHCCRCNLRHKQCSVPKNRDSKTHASRYQKNQHQKLVCPDLSGTGHALTRRLCEQLFDFSDVKVDEWKGASAGAWDFGV